jgi:hypothetical protein
MRPCLRTAAVLIAAATLTAWLMTGASRGWTKTSVAVESTDEITGLSYRTYEKRFQPGIDFLSGGLALAFLMGLVSLVAPQGHRSNH